MKENSKSILRRLNDANFIRKYFRGNGVDIGGKPDPLAIYRELFPLIEDVKTWDWEDGDAQFMESVADESYDFVYSSHCLEHLVDPEEGLRNWFRILKPGGHLVIAVPDEDLYEQGEFPSTFNLDHKWTFTIWKEQSWSDRSINVIDLVKVLGASARLERVRLLDDGYRFDLPRYDQTLTPSGECGIEFVVRKAGAEETTSGRRAASTARPDRLTRIHLNQYRDDYAAMKEWNKGQAPFENDGDL